MVKPTTVTLDPAAFPENDDNLHLSSAHSDEEQARYRAKVSSFVRQLTASGRNAIRKNFSQNVPISLPEGHPTIALIDGQIHTVLMTVADESVISSFHLMESLSIKVTEGTPQDKRLLRNILRRSGTPAPGYDSRSAEESSIAESDCYTSGAFNSDENTHNIEKAIPLPYPP